VSAPRSSPIRVLRLADRGGTEHRQAVWWVALTVAVCALVASLLGLLLDEVYVGDVATAAMLRGYDVVTLIVVVPALFLAWIRARGGSDWARLIMASLLLYLAYTYAYYLFGTGFNDLLLLHTVVFSGSLAALILSLVSLDPDRLVVGFSTRTPVRAVATVLGVLAVALGGMWLAVCVNYLLSESPPTGSALVETDTVVKLGIVLDLTVLVPLYLVAAVLLWRRRPWGFVLATLVLVSGVLHQVSYLVALIAQKLAGVPDAVAFDPLEPAILLLYVAATVGLLAGRRRVPASNDGG
jgi:hypothetical protein